ncbi:MAG TPA: DUF1553 domain-containing protein [Candidatus Hydrogenedentes bacterium]|nr:DUF1553 domain-containing protein [Candidatus Hydrogenedentota bacterium]
MGPLETLSNPSMMHAAVVHMPIVLVLAGIPLVYFVAVSRQEKDTLRWFSVAFYALTALFSYFAVLSGEGAMEKIPTSVPQAVFDIVDRHERMGELVWKFSLGIAVILALSVIPARAIRLAFTGIGMVASIMLAIWVGLLAHFGGELVYDHAIGTAKMEQIYAEPAAQPVAEGDPTAPSAEPAAAEPSDETFLPAIRPLDLEAAKSISYVRDVKPLLVEQCDECHNPDKPRGDFDSTSVLAMIDGGKKGGPGIVPGKPDESSIVKYIRGVLRPQMPKGEDPMTEDQLHVIRLWIAAGAIDDTEGAGAADVAAAPVETAPAPEATPAPTETPAVPEAEVPAPVASEPAAAPVASAMPNAPTVEELLFSGGPEDLLVKRRNYRMALVPKPAVPPSTDKPINNDIDRFIVAKWSEVEPSFTGEVCDDAVFARRVYLDIVGVIPSADEVKTFVTDMADDKRAKLIDTLLARDEAYAAHWTPFWEDALCSNGNHQGGVGTRGNYRNWIFESFKQNKAYDVLTAELLDPHMPNQPLRFVLRQDHTRVLKSAADTAQVFLGTAMKCAGCHNHFDNKEWPQKRFYGFAGFFSGADLELVQCEARTGEFVPAAFVFDLPGIPKDVPATENERAARIAQLIIDPCNPRFAKTIVNRLWKRFVGTGLFEPADDFREDLPASHPELLEWLAYDFMANGYDIKHSMRLILNSRTYQLKYNAALEDAYDVAKPGAPRYFRSPRLRRMSAEQLLDSVKIALGEPLPDSAREYRSDESSPLTRALGRPATRNEVSTARAEDVAVVQTLELLNGDEYFGRIYKGPFVSTAAQRVREQANLASIVDDLYWSVLNRPPAETEKARGAEFIQGAILDPNSPDTLEAAVLDDALPEGAVVDEASVWNWVAAPEGPVFSGTAARKLSPPAPVTPVEPAPDATAAASSNGAPTAVLAAEGLEPPVAAESIVLEQRVTSLPEVLAASADDILYAYVYIDPASPPASIMIEWREGDSWEHRAYWGANEIKVDLGDGPQRLNMGVLPEAGKWVRLEIPAHRVGIGTGQGISGIAFVQLGGTAYWDKAGVLSSPYGGAAPAVGDAMWALITSPEFQYIR